MAQTLAADRRVALKEMIVFASKTARLIGAPLAAALTALMLLGIDALAQRDAQPVSAVAQVHAPDHASRGT